MAAPDPNPPEPSQTPAVLAGRLVVLRPLEPADAPSVQRHADDEAVWRNLFEGFPRPYTLADAQAWCDPARRPASVGWVWGVQVSGPQGAEIAGCIGLSPGRGWMRCNAEIGYWLGQAHWRRGIMTEAVARVTAWAWEACPDITRIFAPVFSWNEGSQRVLQACGYLLEARLPQSAIKDGRVIDRVQYATYRIRR